MWSSGICGSLANVVYFLKPELDRCMTEDVECIVIIERSLQSEETSCLEPP